MLRRCLILAMFLTGSATAHAQFATFIPPKPKLPDSVAAVAAAAQRTRAESASATRIRNMKLWVDSAAGLPPRSARRADTVLAPIDTTTAPPVLVATAQRPATPVRPDTSAPPESAARPAIPKRTGARAPATASDLPLLLVVGALLIVVGVVLIAGAPRRSDHA